VVTPVHVEVKAGRRRVEGARGQRNNGTGGRVTGGRACVSMSGQFGAEGPPAVKQGHPGKGNEVKSKHLAGASSDGTLRLPSLPRTLPIALPTCWLPGASQATGYLPGPSPVEKLHRRSCPRPN
jgi:hypothetical protein